MDTTITDLGRDLDHAELLACRTDDANSDARRLLRAARARYREAVMIGEPLSPLPPDMDLQDATMLAVVTCAAVLRADAAAPAALTVRATLDATAAVVRAEAEFDLALDALGAVQRGPPSAVADRPTSRQELPAY